MGILSVKNTFILNMTIWMTIYDMYFQVKWPSSTPTVARTILLYQTENYWKYDNVYIYLITADFHHYALTWNQKEIVVHLLTYVVLMSF